MAQKTKPVRKSSSKGMKAAPAKPTVAAKAMSAAKALLNTVKGTKAPVRAAQGGAKVTPAKGKTSTAKTPATAQKGAPAKAAPAKTAAPKAEAPVKGAKGGKAPVATVEKTARSEQQIAKAKAALKKETAEAAPEAAPKARGRKISIDINPNEAATALSSKWNSLFKKSEQIESKPYNMKAVFEEKTAIVHKVLGWGYILANRNDRLEVLFKDGIKYLISNYKP